VLIFSPHPDDDVISMGGTLIRLVDQGHEVHVAYQTSGNIAVFDLDALRFADFAADFHRLWDPRDERAAGIETHIEEFLKQKRPGQADSREVQQIKTLIRRGESRASARDCGVPLENLHFLDMPFYETGGVRKKPLGEEDIRIVADLLEKIRPHQIYAAGDLSDPHGTHRVCLAAVRQAMQRVEQREWFAGCEVWLYRGAWQEWEPERIEMAVPLSPQELLSKRSAIFKHQSQKDRAMFPGLDEREFWQRAEARNRATAQLYDRLGLAEYEAIEGFVRWDPAAS
jgi:glucosamine-6-phosphate deaminase